jgi:hypothetical protein
MKPTTDRDAQLEMLFTRWVAMGGSRSLTLVAQQAGIQPTELVIHAKKFGWQGRLVDTLNRARAISEDALTVAIADINRRQITALRELGARAIEHLRTAVFDKNSDAIRALVLAIEWERKILGIGEKTEDVATVLAERLKQAELADAKPKGGEPAPPAIEFAFDKNFQTGEAPLDEDHHDEE